MDYKFKSVFAGSLLKTLHVTGWGKLISAQEIDGRDDLIIDIGPLEIPQYPVNSVMTIERVRITAVDNDLPVVYCRDNFPVVPHLNVLQNGQKSLCLFDVSYEDIKYMFNASMFLQRIVWWFEQTAKGKLHQKDQPLEPFFPGTRDGLILYADNESHFVRLQKVDTPNGVLYKEIPLENTGVGKVYTLLKIGIPKIYTENIINRVPTTLGELDAAFDESILGGLESCIPVIWTIKQTPLYQQLFQQKETELRNSAVLLVVRISLARTKGGETEQYHFKAFQIADTFQALYQSFGYQKDKKGKLEKKQEVEKYKEISITPFEVFYSFDRILASVLNERGSHGVDDAFVQVGLGALGSQIANNCIRSGYGSWVYIDPDVLYPHNLARHCLSQGDVGQNKAQAMQVYANALLSGRDTIVTEALATNIFDEKAKEELVTAIKRSQLVVDCSASVAVERYLSHELAGNTRAVSFFMNPSGTALIMLLENANRSISLASLEMQYYRMLLREKELWNHLKSDHSVLYSSTCRGTSLVYPQENAAIFSGIASKAIKQIQHSNDAAISVWVLEDLSLERYDETSEKFEEITCDSWKIDVAPSLVKRLYNLRKEKLPNETGGVLIGAYDFAHKICYIVDAIDSPADSQEYPCAYIRGCNNLFEKVQHVEEVTIGNLTYVGEWHSHPTDSTLPSADDMKLLGSIASYTFTQGSPGCMMIIGERHYSVYMESFDI